MEDYELPAYEIIVTIPSINPSSNTKIPVVITAKYTFGDLVNGNGNFIINDYNTDLINRSVVLVNGYASFDIDTASLNVQSWGGSYIYSFNMKDSNLNSPGAAQGSFQVVPYSYTIEIIGNYLITPGTSYSYTIVMKNLNGAPAPANTKVTVAISPFGTSQVLYLKSDGTVSSTIAIPANATFLQLSATAQSAQNGWIYAYIPYSGSASSIGVTVATKT